MLQINDEKVEWFVFLGGEVQIKLKESQMKYSNIINVLPKNSIDASI